VEKCQAFKRYPVTRHFPTLLFEPVATGARSGTVAGAEFQETRAEAPGQQ
jgi:hypothetical protein